MKAIKGYFLFFSQHPVLYNLVWFLPSIFIFGFLKDGDPNIKEWYGWALLGLFIGHIILIYIVAGKFILISQNQVNLWDDSNEWLRVAVLEDNQKVILTKPIWAKGVVYFVERPRNLYFLEKEITCTSGIEGRYKNSSVSFPVTIKHVLSGDFDKMEVFEALLADQLKRKSKDEWLCLDEYIKSIFIKLNQSYQPLIDESVGKYARREISEPELMDQLIDVIIFPERLFSNVEDVKLCLGNPTFSSCKGMSCSQ